MAKAIKGSSALYAVWDETTQPTPYLDSLRAAVESVAWLKSFHVDTMAYTPITFKLTDKVEISTPKYEYLVDFVLKPTGYSSFPSSAIDKLIAKLSIRYDEVHVEQVQSSYGKAYYDVQYTVRVRMTK